MIKKTVGLTAAVLFAAFFLSHLIFPEKSRDTMDWVFNPWAHSMNGRPTLAGRWKGQLNFEGRGSKEMALEIRRDLMDSRRSVSGKKYPKAGLFTGSAQVPEEEGFTINYEVRGSSNRDGSNITFDLRPTAHLISPARQIVIQDLRGTWDGVTLKLEGKYSLASYDAASAVIPSGEPLRSVTGTLQK